MKKSIKSDKTKLLRYFIAGIAVALGAEWMLNGGFYEHTMQECITILLIIGIAYGMWVEHWLQK